MTSESQPQIAPAEGARTHHRLIDLGYEFHANIPAYQLIAEDGNICVSIEPQLQGGYDLHVYSHGRLIAFAVPIAILPPRGEFIAYGRDRVGAPLVDPPPMLGLANEPVQETIATAIAGITKRVRANLKQSAKGEWQADTTAEITYDAAVMTDEEADRWLSERQVVIGDQVAAEMIHRGGSL